MTACCTAATLVKCGQIDISAKSHVLFGLFLQVSEAAGQDLPESELR
eukprot:SAG31_NODE_2542_length_5534_cov_31.055934_5_plen_47_part_00